MKVIKIALLLLFGISTAGKVLADDTQCFVEDWDTQIEREIDKDCLTNFLRQYLLWAQDIKDNRETFKEYLGFFEINHLENEAWLQGALLFDGRLFIHVGGFPQYSQDILTINGWLTPAYMTEMKETCNMPNLCRLAPSTSVYRGELSQIILQWFYATTQNPTKDRFVLKIAY